jgi:predicted small lipoprotein YifL
MNRLLSWLIVLGLAAGLAACDKKERVPLPKVGTAEVEQHAKEAR